MTNQENNQAPKNQEQAPSWRDTITEAVKVAREYAKDVADDYIAELNNAKEEDRQDETARTADALRHASEWYRTADQLEEALRAQADTAAAERIKNTMQRASENGDLADWCCPIVSLIGKATQEALTEAIAKELEVGGQDAAQAAAKLAEAYSNTTRWG